ncbi:MAG: PUA domain-containing protein [Candidatus Thorarchaeota archaeon]
MNIKQRHFIKHTEIRDLKEKIQKQYNNDFINQIFPKKCSVEVILTEAGDTLFAINNELKLWKSPEGYLPVLTLLLNNKVDLKTIIVDIGAVRFITNGADVMRPGITKIDPFIKKGDIIKIVDETHNRALAVGKAMFNAKDMEAKTSGKVIKNLHTIKDSVWNLISKWS